MSVGAYEAIFSMKIALENEVPELTDVRMIYDGAKLTGNAKPFASVEYLATNKTALSAGRKSYEYAFRFQVGVFASNFGERLTLQERVDEVLSAPRGIPLFDDGLLPTGRYLLCDVSEFTPIGNDDISNKTHDHHGYFTVSVFIMREFGSDEFTQ